MVSSPLVERVRMSLESAAFPGIVAVYVFGSHALGRAHADSDLDIGVLVDFDRYPRGEERFDLRLRLVSTLSSADTPPIDLVILNDAPPTLGRMVATRGHLLLCRDAEKNHAWVRDVQLMAADLDPFLERMRRIKLQVLRS